MKTIIGQMDGNEWEKYCQKLLRLHYTDYQEVPAQFGGDYGIEGFTRSGLTFQCYCPDEDLAGRDLYEKQRDKITTDINKLIKYAQEISALGAGTIREWHFLTPRYNNRQLLSHCRSKESEIRSKNFATVHNEFTIYLKTEDDYMHERQIYLGIGEHLVHPTSEDPPQKELEKLILSDNEIVLNIKTKLEKLVPDSMQRAQLIRDLVRGYVIGQNELEILHEKFPSMYRSVTQIKSAKESQLSIRTLSSTDNHSSILRNILTEYEVKLSTDFSNNLSSALIARLSMEAISDWLGRCPLNFPNSEVNDENY